jgi:hypothetical protein
MKSVSSRYSWIIVGTQWLCALNFMVFLYFGLTAGYNSTIPLFGEPSPAELFFIRTVLGISLIIGTVGVITAFTMGKLVHRLLSIPPALIFGYVLFFLLKQWISILLRHTS